MNKHILLCTFITALLLLTACGPQAEPVNEKFISCLVEKDVKMYGAFWCGHCKEQKKILGEGVEQIYIECDPKGKNEQSELCVQVGIESYPTFDFGDGKLYSGVKSLEQISIVTECSLD